MSAVVNDAFTSEMASLAWHEHEADPPVKATCFFERGPVLHVTRKHCDGKEPWARILGERLARRLADARAAGLTPATDDCRAFVSAVALQLDACGKKPLLCRFDELESPGIDQQDRPRWGFRHFRTWEKILFVLPSGAVAFARVIPSAIEDVLSLVLLTAFFPREQDGWVVQSRAAAASATRYVERWAEIPHRDGGQLLPEHDESVLEQDESVGVATRRGRFRFVTPETWGFRLQEDGQWAWSGRPTARF